MPIWMIPLAYAAGLIMLLTLIALFYVGGVAVLLLVDLIKEKHKKD